MRTARLCLLVLVLALVATGASAKEVMLFITASDGNTVYLPVSDGSSSGIQVSGQKLVFSLAGHELEVSESAGGESLRAGALRAAPAGPIATATLGSGFPLAITRHGMSFKVEVLGIGQTIVSYEVDLPNGETLRGKSLDDKPFLLQLKGEGVELELRPDFSKAPDGTVPVSLVQRAAAGGMELVQAQKLPTSLRLSGSTEYLRVGTTELGIRAALASTEDISAHLPEEGTTSHIDNSTCCVCCSDHPTCACGCYAECDQTSCCVGVCC